MAINMRDPATLDAGDDTDYDARDESVRDRIVTALQDMREQAQQLRNEATELDTQAATIRTAVLTGEWWKLRGLLTTTEIESLCSVELTDRSLYLVDSDY